MAAHRLPRLRAALPRSLLQRTRLVFLCAPQRPISCFAGRPRQYAWHDYFTDHGGIEGRPNLEEEIDLDHLRWSRAQVHEAIDREAALLGEAGLSRIALVGESQGACVALDAALSYPSGLLGGVFSSYGMLYSHSEAPPEKRDQPIAAFIGAGDRCIGAGLALRSFSRLLEAGYANVRIDVEPRFKHVHEPAPGVPQSPSLVAPR